MTIQVRLSQRTVLRSALVLSIALLLCAGNALAVNVNCGNGDSINTALAQLTATDRTVYITGPCSEYVRIASLQNVTLLGAGSTPAVLNQPPNPNGVSDYVSALEIYNSNTVSVRNINFVGPGAVPQNSAALVAVENSTAVGFTCNISGSVGDGLQVYASQVTVNGPAAIQNNTANGVDISSASNVTIGGWDTTYQVNIQNNSQDGIAMSNGSYLFVYDYVAVTANGTLGQGNSSGLAISSSQALLCCNHGPAINGNIGWGLDAEELSSVVIVGGIASPALSISNNTQGGIYDVASWIGIYNGTVIQNNGDHTQTNPLGGIDVLSNGALQAYGATIENNYGPGLLVSQSSSADLGGGNSPTTITGNTGSGIYVQVNGSVQFDGAGTTVTGNSPKDLTCAAAGIAAEDNGAPPTIGKMSCDKLFDLPPRKHKKAKN